MSSRILSVVARRVGDAGAAAPQKSCAKAFAPAGGRGRDMMAARRVAGRVSMRATLRSPEAMRQGFAEDWARLMRHLYRGAVPISRALGVTEQTARNWLAETCRPTGDKVALVALQNPEAFARYIGGR